MLPFAIGKAIRKPTNVGGKVRPSATKLRKFERDGEEQIAKALDDLRKRLFKGIREDNIGEIMSRLSDQDFMRPFHTTLANLIAEWAAAGGFDASDALQRAYYRG